MRLRSGLAAASLVALALGCGQEAGPEATPTTSPSPSVTATASGRCEAPSAASTAKRESGETPPVALLTKVEVRGTDCSARMVFTFDEAVPGYEIGYQSGPFAGPDGEPVEVQGSAFLSMRLFPASGVDLSGGQPRQTYTGDRSFTVKPGPVRQLRLIEDFEAQMVWVAGAEAAKPFTVDREANRLTVTVYL